MKVSRVETEVWPKDTYEIEHNNVTIMVTPVIAGLEVYTQHDFLVTMNKHDEQFEIIFYEFQETKLK